MSERYAIYYAPPAGSACWRLATAWLGRDPESGTEIERPAVDGIPFADIERVTRSPRHYGFHATLKPPFALADGADPDALERDLAEFAAQRTGFLLPSIKVADLDGFLALVPGSRDERLVALAADCVRAFDRYRAPAHAEDVGRRRKAGLTGRQDAYLQAWGYPYVFDEFRFHMTLTGRLNADERAIVKAVLEDYLAEVLARPLAMEGVALYRQPDRDQPFLLRRRFAFGT